MTLVDTTQPTVTDRQLVNALASRLGDLLADERLDRRARNLREPTNDEEREFARTAVHANFCVWQPLDVPKASLPLLFLMKLQFLRRRSLKFLV